MANTIANQADIREAKLRGYKRELILDAAQRVFAERGLEGASIRAIAEAAGCTTGAIYPWYSGKEEIYAGVLSKSLDELRAAVEREASLARNARDRLRGAVRAFYEYYRARADQLALGLYLFQGLKPRGLGAESDATLNGILKRALEPMRTAMVELGFSPRGRADAELAALFAFLIGLLMIEHTGRIKLFAVNAPGLLENYLKALAAR